MTGWGNRARYRFALGLLLVAQVAAAMESAPTDVYRHRRVALSEKLYGQCALLFAPTESDYHARFRQDNDFYYLTGWTQPGAVLLILAARPETSQYPNYPRTYEEILFLPDKTPGVNSDARLAQVKRSTGVNRVESITELAHELSYYETHNPFSIFTSHLTPTVEATATLAWLHQAILNPGDTRDLSPLLKAMRSVKDEFEVAMLKKAAHASMEAHLAAMHALKPGLYEYEVAALMEYEFQKRGCERPAYASIAASGANAADGHYSANSSKVKSGDLLLLDVAGEYSMYAADVTRTLPVNGKFTDRQRELYRVVRGAELAVIQAFHSGQSTLYGNSNSLQAVYIEYLKAHHMDKFVSSGVGHPVGLNVHDGGENAGAFLTPLVPGSVFNIEPRIYVPEERIGISIEDTFWVDADGKLVNLTAELPVEPEDIERVMATPVSSKP